jgi:hypothetical protein
VIDATCPLVTKVHLEARRFARSDYTILLIGHEGHEEVVGTSGEAPENVVLVGSPEEARKVRVPDPDRVAYLSQTTLSVDETNEVIDVLRERFPSIEGPPRDDICYATQNRQEAVKDLAARSDVILVIGSDNSSNSNRLVEVARVFGARAYLIDDETEIRPEWLEGADTIGVTSGASAPEWLVERVVEHLMAQGAADVEALRTVEEHMRFSLPTQVREPVGWPGPVSAVTPVKAVLGFIARSVRRLAITVAGLALLVAGLVLLVTPGPGLVAIIAGLVVLSSEYAWARRALEQARERSRRAARKVREVRGERRRGSIPDRVPSEPEAGDARGKAQPAGPGP